MRKEEGLTIIELMVTVAIMVATIATVLVLSSRSVIQTDYLALHAGAIFLAKEGAELLEDGNIRNQITEETGEGETTYWNIDYRTSNNVDARDNHNCHRKLRINSEFYVIGSTPGLESSFSRCITAKEQEGVFRISIDVGFDYRNEEHNVILYREFYE